MSNMQDKVIKVEITELQGSPQGPVITQSNEIRAELIGGNTVLSPRKIMHPIKARTKLVNILRLKSVGSVRLNQRPCNSGAIGPY
jgi:hypothetical protein